MSKRDDINELYRPSKYLEKVCIVLFWSNVLLSVWATIDAGFIHGILSILLVIIAFLYMIITVLDDGLFWYRAERERRKNALQDAFGIPLSEYKTDEYYNNEIKDSELSYAANLFESCYFTKEISRKMLLASIIKSLVSIIVLFVACRFISNDDILLIIAQTIFSASVMEETVRLNIFVYRISALFDNVFHEFVTVGITKKDQRAWLRWFCVEYECIKAHYRIRLDESIFNKINPSISKKWEIISSQIKTRAH